MNLEIGCAQVKIELVKLQSAFKVINNDQTFTGKLDFKTIQAGIKTLKQLSEFFEKYSYHPLLGYIPHANEKKNEFANIRKIVSDIFFVKTGGKVDFEQDNYLNPNSTKNVASVQSSMKFNFAAKVNLKKKSFQDAKEVLEIIEKTIKEKFEIEIKIDKVDAFLLERARDIPMTTNFEVANRTGSYVSNIGKAPSKFEQTLLLETQKLQSIDLEKLKKPANLSDQEFQMLKDLLIEVREKKNLIDRIDRAVKLFPGFGIDGI